MAETNGRRKDSDLQAALGSPDPELESLIAPQGYDAALVDEVATMETPAQQRNKAIKFGIISIIILVFAYWLCTPANLVIPDLSPAPYGIPNRPTPPTNKFLIDTVPRTVGDFQRVDLKEEQVFEDPFVGADVVQATYLDSEGNPATVIMIQAESYINARRYLENYKSLLHERTRVTEWKERLYIDENYIQWAAPGFADRAYGTAWNNGRYLIAVTSPINDVQLALAKQFPY